MSECNCPLCRAMAYAKTTSESHIYLKFQSDILDELLMSTVTNGEELKKLMGQKFLDKCLALVDSEIQRGWDPYESTVNIVEFLEWHYVPELRADSPEPQFPQEPHNA